MKYIICYLALIVAIVNGKDCDWLNSIKSKGDNLLTEFGYWWEDEVVDWWESNKYAVIV